MRIFIYLLTTFCSFTSLAQKKQDTTTIKNTIDSINRLLDKSVVNKDFATMKKYYADDFYFEHATGKIDSKESWIKAAETRKVNFASREHDSTVVELHNNVAIVSGILNVRFPPNSRNGYALRYLRVFVYRQERWQLISHHSTKEWEISNE